MTGLIPGWQAIARETIRVCASSASGAPLSCSYEAIPLALALPQKGFSALRVRGEDGSGILLSAADAKQAYLVPIETGWKLVLPQDTSRRRWLKQPESFILL